MDSSVSRLLQDKLYDKRKAGALELESNIRTALASKDHERIEKIVRSLCHDYAYAVHHPHARNGGLIGLAAAAIALGPEVARYLTEIVPPVLACFVDQDARVRYYACESMYNIAKVAKGEILVYFNDVFDALSKLAADGELSVKNGSELLDRLVKDIVSESAAAYANVMTPNPKAPKPDENSPARSAELTPAFSLPRFIPLLQERLNVQNPFARTFLVSWITLLDQIPDLELVAYLPSFLGGLLKYLSDPNEDVHTTTQVVLSRFLQEIKKIAEVKQSLSETKRSSQEHDQAPGLEDTPRRENVTNDAAGSGRQERAEQDVGDDENNSSPDDEEGAESSNTMADEEEYHVEDNEWIPGQDVHIDYESILGILTEFLSKSREQDVQVTALRWIEAFLEICPEDILFHIPRVLEQVLPGLSHAEQTVSSAANRVNQLLTKYIMSLPEEGEKVEANPATQKSQAPIPDSRVDSSTDVQDDHKVRELQYEALVQVLTLQFLHEHEATRVAALAWLIMLHRKSPRKVLAVQEATFPALLKTLSDPSEAVVTRDLLLLSEISKNSDDGYFTSFMVNLLKLFCTDRRLLETRGNLIIRQLCLSLPAKRIYRTMADCLEKEGKEDADFAAIMVQNLNNNLTTAPELADLRKKLRSLDTKDGQNFFTVLFRAWCVNPIAAFSLCLLAQAYEQAYNLLQIIGEMELGINMLIQIDKLIQLLESQVFTYLRMQLLEPERHPYLYKCLYGILMLLPQSSSYAALKNRLMIVSSSPVLFGGVGSGGATHRTPAPGSTGGSGAGSGFSERRLGKRSEDMTGIRWNELLEKFRTVQARSKS